MKRLSIKPPHKLYNFQNQTSDPAMNPTNSPLIVISTVPRIHSSTHTHTHTHYFLTQKLRTKFSVAVSYSQVSGFRALQLIVDYSMTPWDCLTMASVLVMMLIESRLRRSVLMFCVLCMCCKNVSWIASTVVHTHVKPPIIIINTA
jgi:hypothetical protein